MKKYHRQNEPATAALRRDRLIRSAALIRDNHVALTDAIGRDFGHRSGYQTQAADLITTINMLPQSAEKLEQWMQSEAAELPVPGSCCL